MYPAHAAALFRPFPETTNAFVAMSFAKPLLPRWEQVIAPGLRDAGLEPVRVDARRVSNSILTEIVEGICRSRIVFADVSLHEIDGAPQATRNGNVLYELGIAHALRQPEEVVVFRSDKDPLLFDLANIRVNHYDADAAPDVARESVAAAARDALREIDLMKSVIVEQTIASLDDTALLALLSLGEPEAMKPKVDRTMRDSMARASRGPALARLLEMGVLRTRLMPILREFVDAPMDQALPMIQKFELTELGTAVMLRVAQHLAGGAVPPKWLIDSVNKPVEPGESAP